MIDLRTFLVRPMPYGEIVEPWIDTTDWDTAMRQAYENADPRLKRQAVRIFDVGIPVWATQIPNVGPRGAIINGRYNTTDGTVRVRTEFNGRNEPFLCGIENLERAYYTAHVSVDMACSCGEIVPIDRAEVNGRSYVLRDEQNKLIRGDALLIAPRVIVEIPCVNTHVVEIGPDNVTVGISPAPPPRAAVLRRILN